MFGYSDLLEDYRRGREQLPSDGPADGYFSLYPRTDFFRHPFPNTFCVTPEPQRPSCDKQDEGAHGSPERDSRR